MKRSTRLVSLLLAAGMTVSLVPVSAFAEHTGGGIFPDAVTAQELDVQNADDSRWDSSFMYDDGTVNATAVKNHNGTCKPESYSYSGLGWSGRVDSSSRFISLSFTNVYGKINSLDFGTQVFPANCGYSITGLTVTGGNFKGSCSLRSTTVNGGVYASASIHDSDVELNGGTFAKLSTGGNSVIISNATINELSSNSSSSDCNIITGVFGFDVSSSITYQLTATGCTINSVIKDTAYVIPGNNLNPTQITLTYTGSGTVKDWTVQTGGETKTLTEWLGKEPTISSDKTTVTFTAPYSSTAVAITPAVVANYIVILPGSVSEVYLNDATSPTSVSRTITVPEGTTVHFTPTPADAVCKEHLDGANDNGTADKELDRDSTGRYVIKIDKPTVVCQYNKLHIKATGYPDTSGTAGATASGALYGDGWWLSLSPAPEFGEDNLIITAKQDLTNEANPIKIPVWLDNNPNNSQNPADLLNYQVNGGIYEKDVTVDNWLWLYKATLKGGAKLGSSSADGGANVVDCSFTLTGSDQLNIEAAAFNDNTVDAAGYTGTGAAITVGEKGTIQSGSITFGESAQLENNGTILTQKGGTISVTGGSITNNGKIDVERNVISSAVTNNGTIISGIFTGDVVNNGTIANAIFYGRIQVNSPIQDMYSLSSDAACTVVPQGYTGDPAALTYRGYVTAPNGTTFTVTAPDSVKHPEWIASAPGVITDANRNARSITVTLADSNVDLQLKDVPAYTLTLPEVENLQRNGKDITYDAGGITVFENDTITFTLPADADAVCAYADGTKVEQDAATGIYTVTVGTSDLTIRAVPNQHTVTLPESAADITVTTGTVHGKTVTAPKGSQITFKKAEGANVTFWVVGRDAMTQLTADADGVYHLNVYTSDVTVEEKAVPQPEPEPEPTVTLYQLTLPDPNEYQITAQDADGKALTEAAKGEKVYLSYDLSTLPEKQMFDAWTVTAKDGTVEVLTEGSKSYFLMPGSDVTIALQLKPIDEEVPADTGMTPAEIASAAAGGVTAGAAIGAAGYLVGTRIYLSAVLPAGTAIPTTRAALALLLWQTAGKPQPAAAAAELTEAQTALRWCVEQGLLSAKSAEQPDRHVTRVQVIRSWNALQKKLQNR